MSDGIRKWNTSQKSFKHKTLSDSPEKKSPNVTLATMPSIAISMESDDKFTLSRTPSAEQAIGDTSSKLLYPTVMPRIHLLTTSQRRTKFMQRTTTLSNEYFHYSHDDEHSHGPPHILEDLERFSLSSRSSSNSETTGKCNRPPMLADGSSPSPGFLQPPDMLKSNIFLLERPPHKQVMLR